MCSTNTYACKVFSIQIQYSRQILPKVYTLMLFINPLCIEIVCTHTYIHEKCARGGIQLAYMYISPLYACSPTYLCRCCNRQPHKCIYSILLVIGSCCPLRAFSTSIAPRVQSLKKLSSIENSFTIENSQQSRSFISFVLVRGM